MRYFWIAAILTAIGSVEAGEPLTNATPITQAMIPLVITEPGAYVVTENLSVQEPDTHGITIEADHVFIEMQSFMLMGPGDGSGSGIYQSPEQSHLKLSHCKISNWKGTKTNGGVEHGCGVEALGVSNHFNWVQTYTNYQGLRVGDRAYLRRCIAKRCVIGMTAGKQCELNFCTIAGSDQVGLHAGEDSFLEKCTVYSNHLGMTTSLGSTSLHCTAYGNATIGMQGDDRTTFQLCSTYENDVGLVLGEHAKAIEVAAVDNRSTGIDAGRAATISICAAVGNAETGIRIRAGSNVTSNRAIENGMIGIHVMGDNSVLRANHVVRNQKGMVVEGAHNTIQRNVAVGNAIAGYVIAESNDVGPILSSQDTAPIPDDANTED